MLKARFTVSSFILSLLLILIALPAPREGYALIFKLYTVGIFVITFVFIVIAVRKNKILLPKFNISFPFFFFPVFFAALGFLKGNDSYYIIRELFLFLLPILTFIIIINCSEDIGNEDLIKLVLWTAIITSIFLLAYEIFGHLFQFENRFQFRFEFVSRNIGFITLAYILYLFKSKKAIDIFWPGSLLLVSSLVLTMGRLQWIVVLAFTGIFLLAIVNKLKKALKVAILGALLIIPFFYIPYLLNFGDDMSDRSMLWRSSEAKIIVENLQAKEINPYVGNGLGYSLTPYHPLYLYRGESLEDIQRFHSLFLYLLVKTGIIGIAVFSVSVLLLYRHYSRIGNRKYGGEKYFLLLSYFIFIFFVDGCITGHFTMNINTGMELGLFLALMEKLSH